MKKINQGFTNIAAIPTEESLSPEGIKEIIKQSIHLDESDPPFLYCLKVPKLATHFAFNSIPIRRGLFVIGFIEVLIACYALMCLVEEFWDARILMQVYRFIQVAAVVQGVLCIVAAKKFRAKLAKVCYHWKAWEVVVLDGIEIVFIITRESNPQATHLYDSILCVVRAVYGFYVAYVIYSFILLIEKKGNANLVLYGPNLVKLMESIKKQAAAMEGKTETSPDNEMNNSEIRPNSDTP
eukprot:TRINITY_DN10732_c0_g1_i14.p2 TRINITY_DN10732_c0_g1~~TRINITY_DN10732_c0_g1_i14.p2  ORF type:complete len:239 (+),score=56.93 TRINITY_DN10732_c0_g1_i14:47-763(+)